MVVGGHLAIGENVGGFGLAVVAQAFEEEYPVCALEEDFPPVYAAVVDVVVMSGDEFDFAHGFLAGIETSEIETEFL